MRRLLTVLTRFDFVRWRSRIIAAALLSPFFGFAIYLILLLTWPFKWAWPHLSDGQLDYAAWFNQQMALGQVVAGFGTLLLASWLGVIAIQEFSMALERPRLRLALDQGSKATPTGAQSARFIGSTFADFSLAVYNDSRIIAVWYMVQFSGPVLEGAESGPKMTYADEFSSNTQPEGEIQPTISNRERWQSETEGRTWQVTFASGGQVAVYPGTPVPLCAVRLPLVRIRGGVLTIDYTIASDRSDPQRGSLYVTCGVPTSGGYPPAQTPSV